MNDLLKLLTNEEQDYIENKGLTYKYLYLKANNKLNILGQFSIEASLAESLTALQTCYRLFLQSYYKDANIVISIISKEKLNIIGNPYIGKRKIDVDFIMKLSKLGSRYLTQVDLYETDYKAGIIVTIVSENITIATLLLSTDEDSFSHDDINFVATLNNIFMANYLSIEKTNELYNATIRDKLTNAFNRNYLEQYLECLTDKYSVAAIDIDFFKKFNDTYGHHIGDVVLQSVAKIFMESLPVDYTFFRVGGEEFLIIANDTNKNFYENINSTRQSLTAKRWRIGENIISITVSIGIAYSHEGICFEEVQQLADKRLYWVKQNGRNNINDRII